MKQIIATITANDIPYFPDYMPAMYQQNISKCVKVMEHTRYPLCSFKGDN